MNIQNMTANFYSPKQTLMGAHNRPPKLELRGTLIPNTELTSGPDYKFKLATDCREYLLAMNPMLSNLAKKIEWEEVTVKGYIDLAANEIEVEKINVASANDPPRYGGLLNDIVLDIENYKRTIEHDGKIELDDLAS